MDVVIVKSYRFTQSLISGLSCFISLGFAQSGQMLGSVSTGFEYLSNMQKSQGQTLLVANAALGRTFKFNAIGFFSIELGASSGFSGLLDLPDTLQEQIGGPSVVVYAGPRIQILGGIQQNIGSNNGLFLKLGAEANQLNFGRCDINEVYAVNALSQIGLTHKLSAQSQMTLTLTRAYPLKKIHFTTQEADFRLNTPANALGGHIGFQYFF